MASFGAIAASWDAFNSNLKSRIEELPSLAADQLVFEQLVAKALALAARQDKQLADVRETSKERKDLLLAGNRMREFLSIALCKELGFENKRLREFNIRPRDERRKKKPTVETPLVSAPPAAVP